MTLIEPKAKIISSPTLMFRAARFWPQGMTARLIKAGRHHQQRGDAEQGGVHARGDDQLLGHQLGRVGDGLQQAGPADFRRAGAALEAGGALALHPDQVGGVQADKGT